MNVTFQQSWQRLRSRSAALAARLPGGLRFAVGLLGCAVESQTLSFRRSCLSCAAELDGVFSGRTTSRFVKSVWRRWSYSTSQCASDAAHRFRQRYRNRMPAFASRKVPGCYHCRGRKLWFDATIALGNYDGRLRDTILRMKDAEGDALSLAMARLIWQIRGERLAATWCRCRGSDSAPLAASYRTSNKLERTCWPRCCPPSSACRGPTASCVGRAIPASNLT